MRIKRALMIGITRQGKYASPRCCCWSRFTKSTLTIIQPGAETEADRIPAEALLASILSEFSAANI